MEEEVTWGMAVKVWWSMVWRAAIILFATGFIFGLIAPFMGLNQLQIMTYSGLINYLLSIPLGIYLIKLVLNKEYKSFRVSTIRKGIND